uniref:(northern house mosquito) hypothetical protein n=1 Tax=Culex pipiens TaxID=7175 RepID=A0A8D8ADD7_CULPI
MDGQARPSPRSGRSDHAPSPPPSSSPLEGGRRKCAKLPRQGQVGEERAGNATGVANARQNQEDLQEGQRKPEGQHGGFDAVGRPREGEGSDREARAQGEEATSPGRDGNAGSGGGFRGRSPEGAARSISWAGWWRCG